MRLLTAVVSVVLLLFGAAPYASASPTLTNASPSADSTVSVAPRIVRLNFDRPVGDGGPYTVVVTGGGEIWSEPMIGVDGNVVTVPLRSLPAPGEYEVEYEVTPPGGPAVTGQYRFTLGGSSGPTPWGWALIGLTAAAVTAAAFRLARR